MLLYFFATYAVLVISFNLPFLIQQYKLTSSASGVMISLFFLAIMLPGLAVDRVIALLGKKTMFVSLLLIGAGLLLLYLMKSEFFVALGWMDAKTGFNQGGWVLLMVPAMSWLLISPVRMFAFKFQSFAFKGNEIRYIFIALAVVLLVALGIPAVPIVILLYIAISAVGWGLSLKKPGSAACPEK